MIPAEVITQIGKQASAGTAITREDIQFLISILGNLLQFLALIIVIIRLPKGK